MILTVTEVTNLGVYTKETTSIYMAHGGYEVLENEEKTKQSKPTEKYKHFNHHHELTDDHELVDFGDGEFIANKKAIPLLKALSDLGIRTRTHHIDDNGGFFSFIVDPKMNVMIRQVNELDSNRDKYDGSTEVLVQFSSKVDNL